MPTEIYKFDGTAWRAIAELQYMDVATPRDITEVHYNDSGTWRQVFGAAVSAGTAAWNPEPTGNYDVTTTELSGTLRIRLFTSGTWSIDGSPGLSGSPLNGEYRDNAPEVDTTNFEYNITFLDAGDGTSAPDPVATDINGNWTPLDATVGIRFNVLSPGQSGQTSITVQVREIAIPANATTVASFTFSITTET